MSYTRFGEFVRILRIKRHEVMGDMAKVLGVRIPFLSAVENGKKNVPADWADKLISHYNLSSEEQNAGIQQRRAALQFARSFDEMDDETALKILELLSHKGENTD